jgi:hypothetical protein
LYKQRTRDFHTHSPSAYRTGTSRGVGPLGRDNEFDTDQKVPGIVYDYVENPVGSGTIPMGHPKLEPARLYYSKGWNRRYY